MRRSQRGDCMSLDVYSGWIGGSQTRMSKVKPMQTPSASDLIEQALSI
jgi:hypothetical protein